METTKRLWNLFIILMLIFSTFFCTSDNKSNFKNKIFIVHSYHKEYPWTKSIHDGIKEALKNKGCTIETYYMDSKRNTEESFKIKAGQNALEIIDYLKPYVVITSDDNAQEYCGKFLVNKVNRAVVFCGVNADATKYNYPGNNVTGIYERPFIRSSLTLLKNIVPQINSYSVITDNSPTSSGFIQYLQQLKSPLQLDCIILENDFEQWKKKVMAIESDAVITYMYHTVKTDQGPVNPTEVIKWTIKHLKKPTIGFFDFAIQDGVLIGNVESGFEHGELAGLRALEIINGKNPTELPIIKAKHGLIMMNETTANYLHIDISPLRKIADKIVDNP